MNCPACGSKKAQRLNDDMFRCQRCGAFYDCDPEEGGSHSDRDPSWRLQNEERERARKLQPRRNR